MPEPWHPDPQSTERWYKLFAGCVRLQRSSEGFRAEELARLLHYPDVRTYRALEDGTRLPSFGEVMQLANVLHISLDALKPEPGGLPAYREPPPAPFQTLRDACEAMLDVLKTYEGTSKEATGSPAP